MSERQQIELSITNCSLSGPTLHSPPWLISRGQQQRIRINPLPLNDRTKQEHLRKYHNDTLIQQRRFKVMKRVPLTSENVSEKEEEAGRWGEARWGGGGCGARGLDG